jgi:hypothetical protein
VVNKRITILKSNKRKLKKSALPITDLGEQETPKKKLKEIGGREGPDPTRFGDWEKGGRCIDF